MKDLVAPEVEKNALFLDPLRINYDFRVLSWFQYDKREKRVFLKCFFENFYKIDLMWFGAGLEQMMRLAFNDTQFHAL